MCSGHVPHYAYFGDYAKITSNSRWHNLFAYYTEKRCLLSEELGDPSSYIYCRCVPILSYFIGENQVASDIAIALKRPFTIKILIAPKDLREHMEYPVQNEKQNRFR